jgi:hypothetical protein
MEGGHVKCLMSGSFGVGKMVGWCRLGKGVAAEFVLILMIRRCGLWQIGKGGLLGKKKQIQG